MGLVGGGGLLLGCIVSLSLAPFLIMTRLSAIVGPYCMQTF